MDFDRFKLAVIRLAKCNRCGHLVPNSDILYNLYLRRMKPEQVVQEYCTVEAQARRHI